MNFDFTDDQNQLRDALRRWVNKSYSFERRTAIIAAGGYSAPVWQELVDLGLTGLAIGRDQGGLGLGPVEAMIVQEELGRGLVLEPYAPVALMATALLRISHEASAATWLESIAIGRERVVLAHQEPRARYALSHVELRAEQTHGNWLLSGSKCVVPAGAQMDAFIVPARVSGAVDDPSGVALFLVSHGEPHVSTPAYRLQDGSAASELVLQNAEGVLLLPGGPAYAALEQAVDIGMAALCAEGVGVMERLLELTVDYLNTRKQFGVPIASFQALRHRVADMKMQLELARSMSYYATLKLDELPATRRRALAQAKVQLGQSMRFVGQQAVQLHGGIGVTQDYAGSHYFKRLSCIEMSLGDTLHHLGEVAERMQDTAGVFA